MKILVVCQHYWPEPYYLADVCEELVKRGHEVHVVTDVPNYPMGYIYEDYKHRKNREQNRNGVRITRTLTIGRRQNIFFRFLNYYSYSLSSTWYIHRLPGDYDVVFANQSSPVMMTRAAITYSQKWHKKCIMYCMDLWPASLTAGGIKQDSVLYRLFGKVSKTLYNCADQILITSQMFRDYLHDTHQVPKEKILYLPQYAASQFECFPQMEKKNTIDFVFAGNVGAAQKIDVFIRAAKLLENEAYDGKKIRWHIVGDGSELENLKALAKSLLLNNVIFHGRKPAHEMPKYYAMADAMLISLIEDPLISLTLPAKMQTYLASGKPVLASANGEIRRVIEEARCGLCSPAEDVDSFVIIVHKFLYENKQTEFSKNARNYYENNFTRAHFMEELEGILQNSCNKDKR